MHERVEGAVAVAVQFGGTEQLGVSGDSAMSEELDLVAAERVEACETQSSTNVSASATGRGPSGCSKGGFVLHYNASTRTKLILGVLR